METYTSNGFTSLFPGNNNVTQQQSRLWRPWTGKEENIDAHTIHSVHGDVCDAKSSKTPQISHPVKLYWPKSKCFDYLYQDAEMLLRNYPVQATICPYEDSSSDEDSDEDDDYDEEEMDKELN
ncbi:protein ripply2 [Solea solea]|uniref:protein ripply2 n=1 Tax=Solea solea TaxID=90069 RepID=UPI00272A1D7C|nr:protein ripply2 [Solea solea]